MKECIMIKPFGFYGKEDLYTSMFYEKDEAEKTIIYRVYDSKNKEGYIDTFTEKQFHKYFKEFSRRPNNWISVKEDLPDIDEENGDCFLVAWRPKNWNNNNVHMKEGFKSHFYAVAVWENGKWDYETYLFNIENCEVIAWAELPDQFVED